ncbi:MAG: hypothetical protein JWQ35_961 [Bacteriovoracaceae bacterium]|nr:hypothetical protein [Bacteriovoracaceae bacterium]
MHATPTLDPKLDTTEDQFRFLMYVREQIPTLFQSSPAFYFDLFKLLGEQNRLMSILKKSPSYLKELSRKPPLIQIELRESKDKILMAREVQPKVVSEWRRKLMKDLERLPSNGSLTDAIVSRVALSLHQLNYRSSDMLLTTLILNLPEPLRKEAFEKPSIEEKISFLTKSLPEKIAIFKDGYLLGLSNEVSRTQAVERLQFLIQQESEVASYGILFAALDIPDSQPPSTKMEAQIRVEDLVEEDFSALVDPKKVKSRVEHLANLIRKLGQKADGIKILNLMRSYTDERSVSVEVLSEDSIGVRLIEAPELAPFRGIPGVDSSSQNDFATINLPSKRVFLIQELNSGRLKGYVEGSYVRAEKKKSFDVSTVNGHISERELKLILYGFEKAKKALSAKNIILPDSDRQVLLLNGDTPKSVYKELIGNSPSVKLEYLDVSTRRTIEKFKSEYNTADYSKMSHNKTGAILKLTKVQLSPIQIEVKERLIVPLSTREYSKGEVFEFALEMAATNRPDSLKVVLDLSNIKVSQFQELLETVNNSQALSKAEYESALIKAAKEFDLGENFFADHESLVHIGLLQASDAFDEINQEKSIRILIKVLKSGMNHYKINKIIEQRIDLLKNSLPFQKSLASLIGGAQVRPLSDLRSRNLKMLKTLVTMGTPFPREIIPKLIILAKNEDGVIRSTAVTLLGFSEEPSAVDALISACEDSIETVKINAAHALAQIGMKNEKILEALLKGTIDPSPMAREEFAIALAKLRIDDPRVIQAFLRLLDKDDWQYTRAKTAEEVIPIFGWQDEEIKSAMYRRLDDPKPRVRGRTALGLTKIGIRDAGITLALIEALKFHDQDLDERAELALQSLHNEPLGKPEEKTLIQNVLKTAANQREGLVDQTLREFKTNSSFCAVAVISLGKRAIMKSP